MDEEIKQQIIFALEDDNEVMTAALDPDSDLDEENKQMNRELIQKHEEIIGSLFLQAVMINLLKFLAIIHLEQTFFSQNQILQFFIY